VLNGWEEEDAFLVSKERANVQTAENQGGCGGFAGCGGYKLSSCLVTVVGKYPS
jgi:hypothetical protein